MGGRPRPLLLSIRNSKYDLCLLVINLRFLSPRLFEVSDCASSLSSGFVSSSSLEFSLFTVLEGCT